jgi:hypothetical protein
MRIATPPNLPAGGMLGASAAISPLFATNQTGHSSKGDLTHHHLSFHNRQFWSKYDTLQSTHYMMEICFFFSITSTLYEATNQYSDSGKRISLLSR